MNNNIIEVINLHKTFKKNFTNYQILKGVNLTILPGEIYGFLGPNGSGKTTTLKCILGFLKINQGEILLFNKHINSNPNIYKKIGYAPENTFFYDHLNGLEFLIFMGQLSSMTKQEAELNGLSLLEKLGLIFAKDKFIKQYSKGMKQRLGLAASLINNPELIFWDEPTSGLDPLGRILVKKLMLELKEKGKTIFFNTHILPDVQEIADKFGIIYNGQIIYEDRPTNLKTSLEEFFKNIITQENTKIEIR